MSAASLNAGARSLSISGGTHNHNKSIIRAALAITTLIIPFAILSIPALSIRNGLFPLQEHLMKHGPRYIPGSTPRPYNFGSEDSKNPTYPTSGDVVVEHFTGVEEVDRFLTIMNLFFGPAFRDHEVGVLCLHFFGGCMVFLGLLGVEAERSWTGWRRIFC